MCVPPRAHAPFPIPPVLTHVALPAHGRVMIFIVTILLLAADFYYLKNIAGRRLVGLRWWNEVDPATGDSKWVFESSDPGARAINATDSRFFWLAIFAQPALWVGLAVLAIVRFKFTWLPLVGECVSLLGEGEGLHTCSFVLTGCPTSPAIALALTITNSLAFNRCDKFSQASNLAGSAFNTGNLAGTIASSVVGRFLRR